MELIRHISKMNTDTRTKTEYHNVQKSKSLSEMEMYESDHR